MRSLIFRKRVSSDRMRHEVSGLVTFRCRHLAVQASLLLREESPNVVLSVYTPLQRHSADMAHDTRAPLEGCMCGFCMQRINDVLASGLNDFPITAFGELYPMKKNQENKKTVMTELVKDIKAGACDFDLLERYPSKMICHAGQIAKIRAMVTKEKMNKIVLQGAHPTVYVFVGSTGSGKSHLAREIAIETVGEFFVKPPHNKWWCGYGGEDAVIIDEYEGKGGPDNCMDYNYLKLLLDKYPMTAEPKGGSIMIRPSVVIITSNSEMHEWFPNITVRNMEALRRRITYQWRQSPCGRLHRFEVCTCNPMNNMNP